MNESRAEVDDRTGNDDEVRCAQDPFGWQNFERFKVYIRQMRVRSKIDRGAGSKRSASKMASSE